MSNADAHSSSPSEASSAPESGEDAREERRPGVPDLHPVDSFDDPFDEGGDVEELRTRTPEVLNEAPFGIVRLDDDGVVQFYNEYESSLSGVSPEEAVGTNFFTQLAPCSNNPIFKGRFEKGVRTGRLDERFTYTFTYKMRPTLVDVRLYRDDAGNNWVLIHKR